MLPDVPDSLYILAYVVGVLWSPLIHTVLWFVDDPNSFMWSTFAVIAGFFWTAFVFALHALPHPHMQYQLDAGKHYRRLTNSRRSASTLRSTELPYPGDWAATYAAIVREDGDADLSAIVYGTSSVSANGITGSRDGVTSGINLVDRLREEAALSESSVESESEPSPSAVKEHVKDSCTDSLAVKLSPLLNSRFFWFLPRFWDHDYYLANSKLRRPDANRRYMWLFAVLFVFVCCIDYTFLCYFTNYFRHNDNARRIGLFIVYIFVTTIFRFMLKSLGMSCDRKKNVTVSLYFVGEVYGLMFYYTFYRVLFESIKSIPEFAVFQFLHLASEWLLYVVRATEWYYNWTEWIGQKYFSSFLSTQRLPHRHWQRFMALDFGIRCIVFVMTAVGIMLLITTIQYVPYLNRTNDLAEHLISYESTIVFIAAALGMELINAFCISNLYFKRLQLDVREETVHCFALRDFSLLALIACTTLFINPVFAFTTIQYVPHK